MTGESIGIPSAKGRKNIELVGVIPINAVDKAIGKVLIKEFVEYIFLFFGHSFEVTILHSIECPLWDVISSKVFERTIFTTDAEFVFHHLLPVVEKCADFLLLVMDVLWSTQTTFLH